MGHVRKAGCVGGLCRNMDLFPLHTFDSNSESLQKLVFVGIRGNKDEDCDGYAQNSRRTVQKVFQ